MCSKMTIAALAVSCAFDLAFASVSPIGADKWVKDLLLPGSEVHPNRVSRSGWLWNAESDVANGAESFFRSRFSLPSAPKSALLKVKFDDGGAIWLNGRRLPWDSKTMLVPEKHLLKALSAGENVLAVSLRNGSGPSGVVFLMEVGLADGTTVFVHSDESVKAVPKAPDGWQMPGFDDSSWPAAVVQADAVGLPWSNATWATRGLLQQFLTREERQRYDEEERRACELPADFDAGPEPNARIVHIGNLPMIEAAGRFYDPDWNISGVGTPFRISAGMKLAKLGIDIVQVTPSSDYFEIAPGKYDFSGLDRSARLALRMNPKARLIVSPRMNLSLWLAEHPDEAIAYAAGPVAPGSNEHFGCPLRPSAASTAYRTEACRAIAEMCEWIKRQPWANRVIAMRPNWGTYCEWHVYGMWDGPDVGPRMAEAFRRYKDGKWANAEPPTMAERDSGGFLLDPVANAKAIDFFECQQEQVADLAAAFARTIKSHLPGRLVGMWYGYVLTAQAPEGSNVLLDRMLSNPDIDFLSNPATYRPESRRAGGSFMHRTVPATYTRYGKLCMLEDDNRYHHLKQWAKPQYLMQSPEESRAAVQRNYLSKLFDLCGIQFTDACRGIKRPMILDNEVVLKGLSDAMAAFRRARQYVTADSGAEIAVVVDYYGRFQWNSQSKGKVKTGTDLFEYAPIAVHKSGAAFDILTVQDYIASKKPYRIAAFLNLFYPRAEHLSGAKAKLAKDGATAIRLSPDGAPRPELGVKTIAPRDVPVTGKAWAALFKEAGAHVYTAPGSYFRRRGDLMMFCTGTAGVHTISLPASDAGKRFEDLLNGGEYSAPTITLKTDGPKTWLLAPYLPKPDLSERILPEAKVHPDRVAKSGWLWNFEKPVSDGGLSFIRQRFTLPSAPKSVSFRIYFDDSGSVFLNGRAVKNDQSTASVDPAAALAALRAGENTLAVSVKNGTGPGGVIYFVEIGLADGSTVYVHSDISAKGAANPVPGWEKPGFDDSSWLPAQFQADAMGGPWARASWAVKGFLERFMTLEECARYDADERASVALPDGFEPGPEPRARIVYEGAMPMIEVAGRRYDPDWYLGGVGNPWRASAVKKLAEIGVDFIQINTESSHYEIAPGKYDFYELDYQARRALKMNPRAKLMLAPRFILEKWLAQHPDEAVRYAVKPDKPSGKEHFGWPFRPSPASQAFREEASRALREMCEWTKRQPWGNRVVMVRPCWGIYKEWHMFGMWHGPDVGPRMTEAFRRYKGGKWANANPPTMEERASGGFLLDPVANEKAIDFFECQQEQVAELAAVLARTVKTHLPGRLVGMWYGYVMTAQAPEGANVLLDRMLSNPDIDYLSDPATYRPESRRAGGSYMHRTIPSTYHRYGKLCVLEDDNRYDWMKPWAKPQYIMRSPEESRATMLRNYLSKLFDRCGIQFNDATPGGESRPFSIDDDIVLDALSDAVAAFRAAKPFVTADSGADIAVVVDYFGRFHWNSQSKGKIKTGLHLFEYAPIALHKSGAAFDLLTVQDYLASKKRYGTVAFFNMFYPRAEHLAGVKAKLAGDRSTAIRLAPDGAPALDLGVKTITARDVPLTGEAWAALFREAGAHIYVAPGSYFRRQGDLMMFCTGDAGVHTISLPASDAGKRFRDLVNGGEYAAPAITLKAEAPMTWLLAPAGR